MVIPMKKIIILLFTLFLLLAAAVAAFLYSGAAEELLGETYDAKPVIYLYPTETTSVCVKVDYDGEMTCTYPEYRDGWTVTASPDGTLTDASGREYYALFWEGISDTAYDMTSGFCVAGENTAAFLEETLSALGLSDRETNEFIMYWLPKMQDNAYNLITFQAESYTDTARLNVTPAPDTVIRVFMVWQGLDAAVSVTEPVLPETPVRNGFTVVEWGGREVGG